MFPFCFLLQFFSFLTFPLFLVYVCFISPLALADCFSTLCRPGCMQRTLSHVISPTCELAFFCAALLLVVCGVVFLSTIFLMSYNIQIFLVSDTNPFFFFVTVWLHNTYDHISKTAVQFLCLVSRDVQFILCQVDFLFARWGYQSYVWSPQFLPHVH